jgi:hypothetical protein
MDYNCMLPDSFLTLAGFDLPEWQNTAIIRVLKSGRGAARLARLHGVQEVGGSNPLAPTRKHENLSKRQVFVF